MVKITLAKWTNPNSGKSSFATELCKYNCHRISRERYFKHKKALWSLTLKRRSQTIHIILHLAHITSTTPLLLLLQKWKVPTNEHCDSTPTFLTPNPGLILHLLHLNKLKCWANLGFTTLAVIYKCK